MTNAWDNMRKAKEESYFDKKNREALERLSKKSTEPVRLSPVSGEPMEQVVVDGVVIDRCKSSGGIWLDAGELEELISAALQREKEANDQSGGWLKGFINSVSGAK